jgi:phage shock protein PspC (stress-responsive transcriptional regulator)
MARIGPMADDGDMTHTTNTRTDPTPGLHRSRGDRILAGVAGGLGRHLGINAWWVRLAFLVLAFFGGFGLLVYVAAWLVIPDDGYRSPIISQWLGRLDTNDAGTIFGVVLVGAAVVILLTQFADVSGTLVVAAILFIVGFLLYRGDLTSTNRDAEPTPPGPRFDPGPDGGVDPDVEGEAMDEYRNDIDGAGAGPSAVAVHGGPPPAPVAAAVPPPPPPPPPIPRERSMLGRLTVAVGLIVIASMALVDVAFARVEIQPVHYLATAVGILGIGLLVGAWIGRARWLIVIAILLLPAMWFTSLWPDDFSFSAGEVREEPTAVSEVVEPFDLGFGQLTIDLTGLTPGQLSEIGVIEASVGMGELVLRIPNDIGVLIDADIGMGALQGPFADASGIGVDATRTVGPDPIVFEIRAEVGAGVVTVDRAFTFERSN